MSSPLEAFFKTPQCLQPLIELVYMPAVSLAQVIDKPPGKRLPNPANLLTLGQLIDQIMYIVSFLVAIFSGCLLNNIQNVLIRKAFSTTVGILI